MPKSRPPRRGAGWRCCSAERTGARTGRSGLPSRCGGTHRNWHEVRARSPAFPTSDRAAEHPIVPSRPAAPAPRRSRKSASAGPGPSAGFRSSGNTHTPGQPVAPQPWPSLRWNPQRREHTHDGSRWHNDRGPASAGIRSTGTGAVAGSRSTVIATPGPADPYLPPPFRGKRRTLRAPGALAVVLPRPAREADRDASPRGQRATFSAEGGVGGPPELQCHPLEVDREARALGEVGTCAPTTWPAGSTRPRRPAPGRRPKVSVHTTSGEPRPAFAGTATPLPVPGRGALDSFKGESVGSPW